MLGSSAFQWDAVTVAIVTGLLTGALTSVGTWWWLNKLATPKLAWCETISTYAPREGEVVQQIKLRNLGKRPVVDVQFCVRMKMKGLVWPPTTEFLTLKEGAVPVLKNERRWTVRFSELPDDVRRRYKRYLPRDIADRLDNGQTISLLEVLERGKAVSIELYASGSDAFSGARGYTQVVLDVDDVRPGRFVRRSCEHTGDPEPWKADGADANALHTRKAAWWAPPTP